MLSNWVAAQGAVYGMFVGVSQGLSAFFRNGELTALSVELIKILAVLVLAMLTIRFGDALIDRTLEHRGKEPVQAGDSRFRRQQRMKTLASLLKSVLHYTVDFAALMMILTILGIPVATLVAGAGVFGLAVGFGAQNLVRDIITGFFLLYEDQFGVGDIINTAGVTGTVEEIGLRVTKIRDFDGSLHILANGDIKQVNNRSRGEMRVMVDVQIGYDADVDRAIQVLKEAADQYASEHPEIVSPPNVMGLTELASSGVGLRIVTHAVAGTQWQAERDLRKIVKETLVANDIEIPYPHQVMVHKNAPPAGSSLAQDATGAGGTSATGGTGATGQSK